MTNRANSKKVAFSSRLRAFVDVIGEWDAASGPRFRALARSVAGAVERGAFEPGARLPSEREVAAELSVSRGTVVGAYDLLVADGLVERRRGSGTFIVAHHGGLPAGREGSALVHRLVARGADVTQGVVELSLSVLHDARDLSHATLSPRALRAAFADTGYSPSGFASLRAVVAEHVSGWQLPSNADQIVMTTGAQQAISIAAACWVWPNEIVVVEDPTYPGALSTFAAAGARVVGVRVDRFGVVPDELSDALALRPAMVYLQSTLHSPTGCVLSAGRREVIAEMLAAARVPLVEDCALADLAWSASPPPIAALLGDTESVAVVGSFSKTFWGGLRLGFARAPGPLALRLARVKATHDLGSSAVSQVLTEQLLTRPDLQAVLQRRRHTFRERYDALAQALRAELPAWSWEEPDGGLSLWVRVPSPHAAAFAQHALRHGVAVAAADAVSPSGAYPDHLRLAFAAPPEELREGVRRLAGAWQTFVRQ
jgi:DNA-binding transcriptional MocR family regulator